MSSRVLECCGEFVRNADDEGLVMTLEEILVAKEGENFEFKKTERSFRCLYAAKRVKN